jgi:hypothetical protein
LLNNYFNTWEPQWSSTKFITCKLSQLNTLKHQKLYFNLEISSKLTMLYSITANNRFNLQQLNSPK